jgi:chloramphenicol-sensitive protein RarD
VARSRDDVTRDANVGLAYGLAAFVTWGLLPLYFHALRDVPATETLAHRICWAPVVLAIMITMRRAWRHPKALLPHLPTLAITTLLLSTNWLVYIISINTDRVLEASLGYFVTPLVNVALGVVVLRETLSRMQALAIALGAIGVATLMIGTGTAPWISVVLALSFGTYGLLRKRLDVPPLEALLVETVLLVPIAASWLVVLAVRGDARFAAGDTTRDVLLLATGIITALPLVWFAHAARRLRLATIGALQYVAPSLGMLIATLVFGEPFGKWQAIAFGTIWVSLAIYGVDAARRARDLR